MNPIISLKLTIGRARFNLMFMIVLSAINIFFISSGTNASMPFTSAISSYAVALGIKSANDSGNDNMRMLGLLIAVFVIFLFVLCHLLSKNRPTFLVVAFSLLLADTIVLIVLNAITGLLGQIFVILDLLLHILTLVYIFKAIKASIKLSQLPDFTDESNPAIFADNDFGAKEGAQQIEDNDATEEEEEEEEEVEDLTKPISSYNNENPEPLVEGEYEKLNIFVVIEENIARLVINGYICDELNVEYLDEYQLRAIVNEIDFSFEFKRSATGEAMYLYANDTLLDSLGRN